MTIMLTTLWSRLLPSVEFYGDFLINLVLDIWLLTVLHKRGVKRRLPWFFFYISWDLIFNVTTLITSFARPRFYNTVYWSLEIPRVALFLAAVQESILRVFTQPSRLLRRTLLIVIPTVILYSLVSAIHASPFLGKQLDSFELAAEFTFRWSAAIVCLAATAVMLVLSKPRNYWAEAVILGATAISLAFALWSHGFSEFGPRFTPIATYVPDMGYFFAAIYWIRTFSRSIRETEPSPEDEAGTSTHDSA
jgi:hypothetical protein